MEFETRFNPQESEEKIYELWENGDYFMANPDSRRKPFVIVIPPPNVTGSLHMGHALNNTLQDILIRYKRMQGYEALYLPGTDHAGIATQFVVEKELKKEKKARFDFGREKFLQRVWEWKKQYGDTILYQLRRLGCSCDWSRTRFTMDEGYSQAIKFVFVELYKKGLIYRGNYTINWCPRCLTALSDIEVEHKEEAGKLWHFRYPIKNEKNKSITVATTRPETILGDTAVAVNPKDKRYKTLVGKTVVLPIIEREIPIIADDFVDMEFGTGAVKITPAHDTNDFEASKRHNLPAIKIMDEKGVMNDNAGELFDGLDRFEVRTKIVEELKNRGLFEKEEDYKVSLGRCYRCKTIIEPYLSLQWFVKMKPLAKPAIDAVKKGEVKFIPKRWADVYLDWLENTRDWCISRQIWWGHRIPVWYCECGEIAAEINEPKNCPKCKCGKLKQDEDVLDTWFSSALWPFATMGWPDKTQDLRKFYPTQVLVTARDIIYLWVARMVMMGYEFMGEKPFSDVFINPTIQNPEGKRMSKSLGTGVDPLELIDQFGADATRFGLAIQVTENQDVRFSPAKMESSRNFVTKLWNASRFVTMNIGSLKANEPDTAKLSKNDRWILSRLASTVKGYDELLSKYEFGDVAQLCYRFVWNEFCDWYIELSKGNLDDENVKAVLSYTLVNTLKLLHPIMPFVTEEIWQRLKSQNVVEGDLINSEWCKVSEKLIDKAAENEMDAFMKVIKGVREVRNRMGIQNKVPLEIVIKAGKDVANMLKSHESEISHLANIDEIGIGDSVKKPSLSATVVDAGFTLYIPLEGKIDIAKERSRQETKKSQLNQLMGTINKKLDSKDFLDNAPQEMVESEKEKLMELKRQLTQVDEVLNEIK